MRHCTHGRPEVLGGEPSHPSCASCDEIERKQRAKELKEMADLRERLKNAEGLVENLIAEAFHAREDANAWSAIAIRFENDSIRLMKAIMEINDLESQCRSGDAGALLESEAEKARIELKLPIQKQDITKP